MYPRRSARGAMKARKSSGGNASEVKLGSTEGRTAIDLHPGPEPGSGQAGNAKAADRKKARLGGIRRAGSATGPFGDQPLMLTWRGLASSDLCMVMVRTPSLRSAFTLEASALAGSVRLRSKRPDQVSR